MKFSTISTHVTVGDLFNPVELPGLYQCNGRKKKVKLGIVAHISINQTVEGLRLEDHIASLEQSKQVGEF